MSVIYIDINAISCFLDLNIFQQDIKCFCVKLSPKVELAAIKVQSKNINISDLDDLSLASFCQSRAAFSATCIQYRPKETSQIIGLFSWNLVATNCMQCFLYGPIICN